SDYFHISPGKGASGNLGDFGARDVKFDVEYDTTLVDRICDIAQDADFPAGKLGERSKNLDHGTMVPLWFITQKYRDFKLVRCGLSGFGLTDHYRLGKIMKQAIDELGRRTVIVASGDLSHKLKASGPYGFAPEGPQYDERIMDVCGRAAFGELFDFDSDLCDKAAECGHRSFVIMAGALDGMAVSAEKLSHQDVTGVGYGICIFRPEGPDENRHFLKDYIERTERGLDDAAMSADPYVRLAYRTIYEYILWNRKLAIPDDLPDEMRRQQAGTFVSIHKHGDLRGCIGTTGPTTSCIAQEIINNAINASTEDPRFNPITPDELKYLEINVDVLGAPESIESPKELDVKRYGVIVSCGGRRGLLLPDLDGVDSVEQQIAIAMQKGGIRPGEKIRLQRFEVVRHV
ncbi:MAG: AmmeMemoRadiSam system protein A, partial [Lachnospiraceae bacterium]|nr:AmmeMemoRadiSam system protein A [Lachnospiraceae bacterium]